MSVTTSDAPQAKIHCTSFERHHCQAQLLDVHALGLGARFGQDDLVLAVDEQHLPVDPQRDQDVTTAISQPARPIRHISKKLCEALLPRANGKCLFWAIVQHIVDPAYGNNAVVVVKDQLTKTSYVSDRGAHTAGSSSAACSIDSDVRIAFCAHGLPDQLADEVGKLLTGCSLDDPSDEICIRGVVVERCAFKTVRLGRWYPFERGNELVQISWLVIRTQRNPCPGFAIRWRTVVELFEGLARQVSSQRTPTANRITRTHVQTFSNSHLLVLRAFHSWDVCSDKLLDI